MRALVSERLGDAFGKRHLTLESIGVLWSFGAARQHHDIARTRRQSGEPDVDAGSRHMLQQNRDDPRGQPRPAAAH